MTPAETYSEYSRKMNQQLEEQRTRCVLMALEGRHGRLSR